MVGTNADVAHNGVTSCLEEVNIPSYVTYDSITYTVVKIGKYAFSYCPDARKIFIPKTVKAIGWAGFIEM